MLEVEDEVLPREEASSARVLGDENGVSGRTPSFAECIFCSRKKLSNFFCRKQFAVYFQFFLKIMSEQNLLILLVSFIYLLGVTECIWSLSYTNSLILCFLVAIKNCI